MHIISLLSHATWIPILFHCLQCFHHFNSSSESALLFHPLFVLLVQIFLEYLIAAYALTIDILIEKWR